MKDGFRRCFVSIYSTGVVTFFRTFRLHPSQVRETLQFDISFSDFKAKRQ